MSAGDPIAAFTIADKPQTLIYGLTVSGALQAALIPVRAGMVLPSQAERRDVRRVGGALVTWIVMAVGLLAALGAVFAVQGATGLVWISGDASIRGPKTHELTGRLLRIDLPAVAPSCIGTVLRVMLHMLGEVTAPALGAVRNAAVVIVIPLMIGTRGVERMAWGAFSGAALIVTLQKVLLGRHGALLVPNIELGHLAARGMGRYSISRLP